MKIIYKDQIYFHFRVWTLTSRSSTKIKSKIQSVPNCLLNKRNFNEFNVFKYQSSLSPYQTYDRIIENFDR